ncbi:hypothetical protein GCM10023201_40680 [Actinomycetospora corticicola]
MVGGRAGPVAGPGRARMVGVTDLHLPVHVEDQVRAELRDLAARGREDAPTGDEVLERMAANGWLMDPERE